MHIREKYKLVREQTVDFCSYLTIEDYSIQVVRFASPAKWHLAHTTWFFETFILIPHLPDYAVFDEDYNYLFNSYYNNVGDRIMQANRGNMSRPSIYKVYEYRKYVDDAMFTYMEILQDKEIIDLIILGLNHEQQHQELLITDVKYMLGHNPLFPIYKDEFNLVNDENLNAEIIHFQEGIYEIGYRGNGFCYDNELGVHQVYQPSFNIHNHLVTNGEFIEFIEDNGYSDFNLWLHDGWHWINKNQVTSPLYWHQKDGQWFYYTLSGLKKVNPNAILSHISYFEATAYAEWKGLRLPTEYEWEIASQKLDWGKRWEWTNSAYLPYPGFKKAEGAVGEYNGKFMSNRMVLRGASVATSANHSRNTYRNFFNPHERWQFTGIRLAE